MWVKSDDVNSNLALAEEMIPEAATHDCDIIAFPECLNISVHDADDATVQVNPN